eukprot:1381821-Rhodomonas_salina.3
MAYSSSGHGSLATSCKSSPSSIEWSDPYPRPKLASEFRGNEITIWLAFPSRKTGIKTYSGLDWMRPAGISLLSSGSSALHAVAGEYWLTALRH